MQQEKKRDHTGQEAAQRVAQTVGLRLQRGRKQNAGSVMTDVW